MNNPQIQDVDRLLNGLRQLAKQNADDLRKCQMTVAGLEKQLAEVQGGIWPLDWAETLSRQAQVFQIVDKLATQRAKLHELEKTRSKLELVVGLSRDKLAKVTVVDSHFDPSTGGYVKLEGQKALAYALLHGLSELIVNP